MTLALNNRRIYDDFLEPIIVIDTETHKIIYCNTSCVNLQIAKENADLSELSRALLSQNIYDTIYASIQNMKKEIIIEDVFLHTYGEGIIHGDIRAAYVGTERRQLYMMFRYTQKNMRNVFLKSRCFEFIYTMSYSYPFHLNVGAKIISFLGTVEKDFNVMQTVENYPDNILKLGVIHEDDIDIFLHVVEKMYQGITTNETFRSFRTDGEALWYQVRCVANRDSNGNPIEVIGEFVNVQDKKELEIKLRTDELTGCLNKIAFHDTVSKELTTDMNDSTHALFIIDLDNFKSINDNLGHPFGDSVLREVGEKLSHLFSSHDYIGRIGGDEFMVFMKHVPDIVAIESQAKQIMKAFDTTYKGYANSYRTTASIGISLYPKDGQDFSTLYEHADIALYSTKCKGKNNFTFYDMDMGKKTVDNSTPFDSASHALSQHFDQRTIAEVFSLLADSKDHSASLNKVLAMLGTRFKVSRCYIFEYDNADGGYFNNTYEWCASGIESEIDNLQLVPQEVYQPLLDLTNTDGIFYCNNLDTFEGQPTFDVMKNQGIKSCLFSFNKAEDQMVSMVGFDDCVTERIWSTIEISTLMHTSKIINQFIKYVVAVNSLNMVAQERLNVLEELHSYSYIIDEKTCEMIYFNQELQEAFPDVKKGDYCYRALQNKTEQCENCPMIQMNRMNKRKYRCTRTNMKINRTMLVNVTSIGLYEGRKCKFFSCNNLEDMDE